MRFADPYWLLLLAGIVATAVYLFWKPGRRSEPPRVRFSLAQEAAALPQGPRVKLRRLPVILRLLALIALVVAMARPQGNLSRETFETEGIDIMLVLDVSGSMRADDFKPNRLMAARDVAAKFVAGRVSDRIGFITFSESAITRSPLTVDHAALRSIIEQTTFSDEGRTAIGTALATAVNRLRESDAESRVVILLTDGQNNAGEIDPMTAAELAGTMGVKVYTIGAGLRPENAGTINRMFGMLPEPVDEKQLTDIATRTGGRYFRAEDEEALRRIYEAISKMETKPIEAGVLRDYEEYFPYWVLAALLLSLAEFLLRRTYLQGLVTEGVRG